MKWTNFSTLPVKSDKILIIVVKLAEFRRKFVPNSAWYVKKPPHSSGNGAADILLQIQAGICSMVKP